ncbi:MAG: GDCCVxC domain-containing (seleno)protein [Chloroflexi bacterium]|nr:GDCCVxC domain-containing (seleno)protein [Chloroflexota bacterium]
MQVITTANLTCPECSHVQRAEMPENACVHFFECDNCHALLKPLEGHCCVFCSYADTLCPIEQVEQEI